MNARREYAVIGALCLVFAAALVPALATARQERRDGMRRDELAAYKTKLEQLNNKTGYYPLAFDAGPHQYVVDEQAEGHALGWHFRAQLEREKTPEASFDYEQGRNYYYRIVREGETTYYDICGGTSTCGAPLKES